jgi:cyclase
MLSNFRIIPRLDIKGKNLVKTINLEGLRVLGCPNEFAVKYYQNGADELLFMDVVASLYGRNQLEEIILEITKNIFIPITVGGGIRTIEDARLIFKSGADKVAINSAAVKRPELISDIASKYGNQSVVLSIEAKRNKKLASGYEVYIDSGREPTMLDLVDWVKKAINFGVGEILLTSIDKEGTKKGFDIDLISCVSEITNIPLIVSGGMGKLDDIENAYAATGISAFSSSGMLHYNIHSISEVKEHAKRCGFEVRDL